jgi:RNA polymerase sigma factor (sigma-70 family)
LLSADQDAQFWIFYRKTSESLFRKAYRMCRGHQADAEDAHQRTYLRALEHWPTVSALNDQQRNAWLATTLTREVLQIWRALHRSRERAAHDWRMALMPPNAYDAAERSGTPTGADGADAVFVADRYRKACWGIAQLEGRPRDVIALHCLGGYEISEVATMLGISAPTVRVHLHVARRRLREIVAGAEEPA